MNAQSVFHATVRLFFGVTYTDISKSFDFVMRASLLDCVCALGVASAHVFGKLIDFSFQSRKYVFFGSAAAKCTQMAVTPDSPLNEVQQPPTSYCGILIAAVDKLKTCCLVIC